MNKGDDVTFVYRGPAAGEAIDGDVMTQDAIQDLEAQAHSKPVFLNHSYSVPAFGAVEDIDGDKINVSVSDDVVMPYIAKDVIKDLAVAIPDVRYVETEPRYAPQSWWQRAIHRVSGGRLCAPVQIGLNVLKAELLAINVVAKRGTPYR